MKKFVAMMLALVMCLACMTACSAPADNSSSTPANDSAVTDSTDSTDNTGDATSTPDTPANGVTVRIGGIGPISGDYANYGTSVKNAAQLAVDEINAAGGVNGMTFVLDFQDSVGDPDSAVNAYGKLIDNGMNLSLGGVLSGETASIVAAAREDGIPVLTPSASADNVLAGNDAAFRVCFRDSSQGTASADYIADNNLTDKVAVFYQSDIDYSAGLYDSFKEECAARNIEIVEVQTFTDGAKTDFSTQINAIKDSGVNVVFIPIYAAEASVFVTQAQGKLDGMYFFGCDGLDGILTKVSDPAQAENVMMLTPFAADSTEPKVQAFVSAYQEAFGAVPDQFAANAYDAIYAFKAALEKAGITDPSVADFNQLVVDAMLEITVDGVTGSMSWTEDGETVKPAQAMIIHDGVAELYGADNAAAADDGE